MRAAVYFEGAGGSTCGLRDAGYDTIGFEYWQTAVDTAIANGHFSKLYDLSDPAFDHRLPRTPVAWFSPPCQPFSAAGDGEGEFDDRDGFPWTLRIITKTLPAVVFIENVKGLTFAKHSDYFGGVLAAIRNLGYEVEWKVLNTADYGVPQTRERCIIIARRDGGAITWPMPTHTEQPGMFTEQWVSMAQALGWGEGAAIAYNRGSGLIERHGERRPFTEPAPTISTHAEKDSHVKWALDRRTNSTYVDGVGPTATVSVDRPAPAVVTSNGQWLWVKAGRDANATVRSVDLPAPTMLGRNDPHGRTVHRPATTIAGDTRVWPPGHKINQDDIDAGRTGGDRAGTDAIRLTIPELATLQGFPPGYVFTGTKTAQAKQVGNAVPPRLAQVVAEANRPAAVERAA